MREYSTISEVFMITKGPVHWVLDSSLLKDEHTHKAQVQSLVICNDVFVLNAKSSHKGNTSHRQTDRQTD